MINVTTCFIYAGWNDQCLNSYILWANNGSWMDYKITKSHIEPLWPVSKRPWASAGSLWFCEGGGSEEREKRLQWTASCATVALFGGAEAHWSHGKGTHSISNSTDILFKNIVQIQHVPSITIYVHFLSRIVSLCTHHVMSNIIVSSHNQYNFQWLFKFVVCVILKCIIFPKKSYEHYIPYAGV
jgi:hypothetical protein